MIHWLLSLLSFALVHLHHNETDKKSENDATNGIEKDNHCAWPQTSVPANLNSNLQEWFYFQAFQGSRQKILRIDLGLNPIQTGFLSTSFTLAALVHQGTSQGRLAFAVPLPSLSPCSKSSATLRDKMQTPHLCYLVRGILQAEKSSLTFTIFSEAETILFIKCSLHTGCHTLHNVVGCKSRVRLDCERCSRCIDSTWQIATLEKVSQTRIHPAVGLAGSSRIIPYPPVSSRNTPYSQRRAWFVCWRRSFAKCRLARTKAEGLNCLQCGTLFMRTWLNFANFKDTKCNDYINVWIEVWGLLMVVSTICMSHDGLFSNNWLSGGCTLYTLHHESQKPRVKGSHAKKLLDV